MQDFPYVRTISGKYNGNPFFESLSAVDSNGNTTADESRNLIIPQLQRTDRDSPKSLQAGVTSLTLMAALAPTNNSNMSASNAADLMGNHGGLRYEDILTDPTATEDAMNLEPMLRPTLNMNQENHPSMHYAGHQDTPRRHLPVDMPVPVDIPAPSRVQQQHFGHLTGPSDAPQVPVYANQWAAANGFQAPAMQPMMFPQAGAMNAGSYYPPQFMTTFRWEKFL